MKKLNQKILLIFVLIYFVSGILVPSALAYETMSTYKVSDTNAASGDILSNTPQGLIRSATAYDIHTFGVIVDDPLAVYRNLNPDPAERPIATEGDVVVNVTDYNGAVSPGDNITASPIPGKGMKAIAQGYILGIATSTLTAGQPVTFQGKNYTSGQIRVSLRIGFTSGQQSSQSIFSNIASSFFKNAQDPSQFALIMRFIIAGLIAVLAFVIGFYAFTRSITKGIEAMGRNPLAKSAIQTSIIIQVVLTLVVIFGAIVLVFLILRA